MKGKDEKNDGQKTNWKMCSPSGAKVDPGHLLVNIPGHLLVNMKNRNTGILQCPWLSVRENISEGVHFLALKR